MKLEDIDAIQEMNTGGGIVVKGKALDQLLDLARFALKSKDALERISMFNPSYEYTFENARTIANEALEAFPADRGKHG